MDESFGYRYNPNYVPEPKFIPGYGGYLPGVLAKYGINYGNISHQILRNRPLVAARLAPLRPESSLSDGDPLDCKCLEAVEYHKGGMISNQEKMFIPEYVCPGYTGCLTLKKKGLPVDLCCDEILRSLGCEQDPYEMSEAVREDPIPGPPKKILDHTQERRRCNDGMWKRFPKNYIIKELHKWM